MSNRYLEIGTIEKGGQKIFNFPYPFYNEDHRKHFEEKFLLEFRYEAIGQETLQRFRYMLQSVLTTNYTKYKFMYDTQLKAQELKWWNNKDYKMEQTREVKRDENGNNTNNITSTNEGNNNSKDDTVNSHQSDNSSKTLDTPQGSINNLDDYLTGATIDKSSGGDNTVTNSESKSNGKSDSKATSNYGKNENESEKFISIEEGNIGTTSSADLIKGWITDGLIQVDLEIFNDCRDLFMLIY